MKGKMPVPELASEFASNDEFVTLLNCLRKGHVKDRQRAAVVLARKNAISNRAVAEALNLSRDTTRRYYLAYLESGIKGLYSPVS